eukprot:5498484-Karenia_brevis.AAC.1
MWDPRGRTQNAKGGNTNAKGGNPVTTTTGEPYPKVEFFTGLDMLPAFSGDEDGAKNGPCVA